MKVKLLLGLIGVFLLAGCTTYQGEGCSYDTIDAIETRVHYDIHTYSYTSYTAVYLTHDTGTGGRYRSETKGSYCINEADKELLSQLEHYAETGERVKICFINEYTPCDYNSRIYSVEVLP